LGEIGGKLHGKNDLEIEFDDFFLFPGGSGGFAAQRSTHSELFLIFYPRFCVDYA